MQTSTVMAVCAAFSLFSAASASIVVFGDSFTDSGHGANPVINAALSTDQMNVGVYPPAPYYKGRFSNGPTWVEYVAAVLGQDLKNLATGNAATGSVPGAFTVEPYFGYVQTATMVPVPSSYQQATAYAALHGGSINPNDWYFVFIGANDFVYAANMVQNATNAGIVQYINNTMTAAYTAGARKFVVMNILPLASLPMFAPPYTNGATSTNAMNYLSTNVPQVNSAISQLIENYPSANADATVLAFDTYTFFENATANAADLGFTNTNQPCLNGPTFFNDLTGFYNYTMCSNPAEHIFWDLVHPTKAFHNYFGRQFVAELGDQINANTIAGDQTAAA